MSDLQNLDRLFEKIVENHKKSIDIDDDLKDEFLSELRKFEGSINVEKKFLEALTTQEDPDDEPITGTHESGRRSLNFNLFVRFFMVFRGAVFDAIQAGIAIGIEYSYTSQPQPQAVVAIEPSNDESAQSSSKDNSKKK